MRLVFAVIVGASLCACNCGGPGTGSAGGGSGTGGAGTGGAGAGGGAGGSGGAGGGGTVACIPGATGLSISPMASQLTSLSAVQFTVTATTATGMSDATSKVKFTVTRGDDTPPGAVSASGSYTPPAAGAYTVTATDGCVTTSTTLNVKTQQTFNDPGPTVTARFGGTVVPADAAKSPTIVYPHTETRFPRNIYKVLFQWRKQGNDFFKLTFTGPNATVTTYTDGAHPQCAAATPPAGCFESDLAVWTALAGGNAGEVVTLVVDGVRAGDAQVYRSAPIKLGFSRRDVKGAIFYWSTTAAGIRRASVSEAVPEAYVVGKPVATTLAAPGGGAVKCVACHTVSRSGQKIIAFTETAANKGEYVYDVTLTAPPKVVLTTEIAIAKGFGTFSFDDQHVVATVGKKLSQFDAKTGVKLADLPAIEGTNPDWSPAGDLLVYSNKGGDSPGGAALDVLKYTAPSSWGMQRTLVPAGTQSNLFPSFSPTGSHVAYARGKGGHGDKTFQLFLVAADGGTPVELINANRLVNNTVTTGQFENNMPTWAPSGDYEWIAFNTLRPYGVVLPNGGAQQIWVVGIDKSKLDQGVDPSFPAFRFAFQDLQENNHRAFWTLDVRQEADAGRVDAGVFDAGPPVDAGMCLNDGLSCEQTAGPTCCFPLVCDVGETTDGGGADGGTHCKPLGGLN